MSAAAVTSDSVAHSLARVLRRQVNERRYGAQRLAEQARVTPRTAENWIAGTNAPRAAELIRLMASNDEIAAEILRLVAEAKQCSRS